MRHIIEKKISNQSAELALNNNHSLTHSNQKVNYTTEKKGYLCLCRAEKHTQDYNVIYEKDRGVQNRESALSLKEHT